MTPDLTLALPLYRARDMLWLQMESLCRQDPGPAFELLILEDGPDPVRRDYFNRYRDDLERLGMTRLWYGYSEVRLSLSDKWRMMGLESSPTRGFLLVGDDNYSYPTRLIDTYHALEHAGFFHTLKGHFLNVLSGDLALYDHAMKGPSADQEKTSLFMGVSTPLVWNLPSGGPMSGVDGWLRSHIGKDIVVESKGGPCGLHTDGYNRLSHHRRSKYYRGSYTGPFRAPVKPLGDIVPEDIERRLLEKRLKVFDRA